MGSLALWPGGGAGAVRVGRRRLRVRTAVDRGRCGEELFSGGRSFAAAVDRARVLARIGRNTAAGRRAAAHRGGRRAGSRGGPGGRRRLPRYAAGGRKFTATGG